MQGKTVFLIAHCDVLIAYAWQPGSNALSLVHAAAARVKSGRLRLVRLPARPETVT